MEVLLLVGQAQAAIVSNARTLVLELSETARSFKTGKLCTEAANTTRSMIFTISDSTVVFRFLRLIECYRA